MLSFCKPAIYILAFRGLCRTNALTLSVLNKTSVCFLLLFYCVRVRLYLTTMLLLSKKEFLQSNDLASNKAIKKKLLKNIFNLIRTKLLSLLCGFEFYILTLGSFAL